MATATRVPSAPVRDTRDVLLTLTYEEAVTLMKVCDKIAGPPTGRRGHTDAVKRALQNVDLHELPASIATGRIQFED